MFIHLFTIVYDKFTGFMNIFGVSGDGSWSLLRHWIAHPREFSAMLWTSESTLVTACAIDDEDQEGVYFGAIIMWEATDGLLKRMHAQPHFCRLASILHQFFNWHLFRITTSRASI